LSGTAEAAYPTANIAASIRQSRGIFGIASAVKKSRPMENRDVLL
jgi:hypothetical protein